MKFRTKTILGIALIEGILLTILGLSVLHQLQSSDEAELDRRIATTARLLSASVRDALISYDIATLESVTTDIVATGDVAYVRVLGPHGRPLVERGLLHAGTYAPDHNIWSIDDGIYDSDVDMVVSGQSFGRIQFGVDVAPLQAQMAHTRNWALSISVLEMLLVAAFSFVLGTYLTRQLQSLRNASLTIASGDLTQALEVTGNDELADTAAAFNQMAAKLRAEQATRTNNDVQLQRQMAALNALNEVAALTGVKPLTVLRHALQVATEHLHMEFGIISQVQGDDYRIVVQVSPPNSLSDDQHFSLGVTYCSTTLETGDLLTIHSVDASKYQGHPCFRAFGLASYAGIPIWVQGQLFGTLNFSSAKPRARDFDHFERAFIRLMSRWVSAFLERMQAVDELQQSEQMLAQRMQELNTILDNSSVGISFVRDRRLVWVNQRMYEMLGYSPQDMDSQDTRMFYASQDAYDKVGQIGYEQLMRGERFTSDQQMRCKDGTQVWMRLSGKLVDRTKLSSGSIWVLEDISDSKQAEQQLRIAATAFEAQEGMVVTDAANVILRVNQAFTDITGYSAAEVVGRKISLLKSGHHDAAFYAAMWQGLRDHGTWQGEVWNRRKNGDVYPEWLTITAVKDAGGAVAQYVATLTDITLRKAAEDEVKQLAFYDPLTQLPNRRLLLNRLQQALVVSQRSKRLGALLFIDLDNFKTLNDTLGHDVGDRLLQQVGQRLSTCVRECDTVARLGGDEFVVMLEDLSDIALDAAAQTEAVGHKILATLHQPYALDAQPYQCTASIGATLFSEQHNSVDELMKRADLAMYESKAAGRNTLRFFDPQMQVAVTARASLEADLRRGLQEQQFCLYYQCQVDASGRVTGAEALVRWQHPVHGLMSPADFIPLAEETRLILGLGHWVLETACQQLVAWASQAETAHLSIAVNVSAAQFRQIDFVDQVLAVVQRSGATPKRLKLELTESLLLDNVEDIVAKMNSLKSWGIGFSLDDFGTGYSSLSYLKRLPLDQLKIDKTFVRDLLSDPNDVVIARTIVALAQSMGLSVIAEGVETQAQRDCLASEGCTAYQGYLFGRPLPLEQFEARLKGG